MDLAIVMLLVVCAVSLILYAGLARRDSPSATPAADRFESNDGDDGGGDGGGD